MNSSKLSREVTATGLDPVPLDRLCINTIRFLSVDAIEKAKSGHPGLPMGAAPMAYVLWTRFLRHQPTDPDWADRDRFVLSAGHGSILLYSLLHLTGYDLPLEQIKQFRQWGSQCPGHPERGLTPGVVTTTGPLGQGFANSVGLAIAENHLAARYNRPHHTIVDHHTYTLAGDGDLMEGVSAEAASLAGHLKLGKLICLYDDNHITLSGAAKAFPDLAHEFQQAIPGELPEGWDAEIPNFPADPKGIATRVASGEVLKAIAENLPALMGGSADLDPSTHTALKARGDFENPNPEPTPEALK